METKFTLITAIAAIALLIGTTAIFIGSEGQEGAQGPQGIPGTPGETGSQGPAGAQGAQGPQGSEGQDGAQGSVGPAGPAGVSVIQGSLVGKITNLVSSEGVDGATVTTTPPTIEVVTDTAGDFIIPDIPAGVYTVRAIKQGYTFASREISVLAAEDIAANIALTPGKGYAGSEACLLCHKEQYNLFKVSGHSYKLRTAEQAMGAPIPLPEGYVWDDITYVIGGYKWKARFIGTDGYIITATAYGEDGKNQYNMMTGTWSNYHAGEVKPYNCGACHTTGYFAEGNQDNLPGLIGTWEMPGVQCEACHGPGREHIARGGDTEYITVDTSAAQCGGCHIRGDAGTIPASGGFIRHHEQYNEQQASPMAAMNCVDCHEPHTKAEFGSTELTCATCHPSAGADFEGSAMQAVGVECMDCHMPRASKSAQALGDFEGDVRTHLWIINTDAEASMFSEDGGTANGYLTVDFTCLQCHPNQDKDWASQNAVGVHTKGK